MKNSIQDLFESEENELSTELARWEKSDESKGQIYTRPEIVAFMLTAIGLHGVNLVNENIRVLEPSCGEGEFVIELVKRLVVAPQKAPSVELLKDKILCIDLVLESINITKSKVREILKNRGYKETEIEELLNSWFQHGDFLLLDLKEDFTHVVGNPPYVRVENIPKKLLKLYRDMYATMHERADLYIPFFEKSLLSLKPGGRHAFICTDRWVKNSYGSLLRKLVSDNFTLDLYIDLYGRDAFEKSVMTYPAITIISKKNGFESVVLHDIDPSEELAKSIYLDIKGSSSSFPKRKDIVDGSKPWLFGSSDQIELVSRIESEFRLIEEVDCKVYIGAATGANKVYIVNPNKVELEEDRLVPVITASELRSGEANWKGKYIINTYDSNGVVDIRNFPKLGDYLLKNSELLKKRHVAKNDKEKWFKTIDRVYPERQKAEKLLIPDISSKPKVIYDSGKFYPNNSIYYITSNSWNLHALKAVLLSRITKLFISLYSTKISGGYLRFQAQHLRKIRLPNWNDVDENLKLELIDAGLNNYENDYTRLACMVYGLSVREIEVIGG